MKTPNPRGYPRFSAPGSATAPYTIKRESHWSFNEALRTRAKKPSVTLESALAALAKLATQAPEAE